MVLFSFMSLLYANGQSTHCWISEKARDLLPNGELSQLLLDIDNEIYWRNGSMFPDGGYPQGDDYGEIAHWEPFLMVYMDWIKGEFEPPYSPEAQKHIAFLMGMASHGMADQSFDSMYMSRAWVYDAEQDWEKSMDEATDVVFVAQTYGQSVDELWVPEDLFVAFYENHFSHLVSTNTLDMGQKLLEIALFYVEQSSLNEDLVVSYETQFPWATNNLFDELISGSPPTESVLVAKYWQFLWEELHSTTALEPTILTLYPMADLDTLSRQHQNIESRWTIVFSSALDGTLFTKDFFSIQNSSGMDIEFDVDLFYGNNSHIVHIMPKQDWEEDSYHLTISEDLAFSRDLMFLEEQNFVLDLRKEEATSNEKITEKGCSHTYNYSNRFCNSMLLFVLIYFYIRKD